MGCPGVARSFTKQENSGPDLTSFFFDMFPSLEEYVLAYDWSDPDTDFSGKGV